jgi:NCAIR mutase (PurE)-related protein
MNPSQDIRLDFDRRNRMGLEEAILAGSKSVSHLTAILDQAAERFTALAGSISAVDRSDLNRISGDLLPAAMTTCEVGDWQRYEQVRVIA